MQSKGSVVYHPGYPALLKYVSQETIVNGIDPHGYRVAVTYSAGIMKLGSTEYDVAFIIAPIGFREIGAFKHFCNFWYEAGKLIAKGQWKLFLSIVGTTSASLFSVQNSTNKIIQGIIQYRHNCNEREIYISNGHDVLSYCTEMYQTVNTVLGGHFDFVLNTQVYVDYINNYMADIGKENKWTQG